MSMEEVEKYLLNLRLEGYLVCATSGGTDSMSLLHMLNKLYPNKIICAHVNHQKRIESEEEKEFLQKYCKENNIIFEYTKLEKNSEGNFHEYARKKRYEFFKKVCKKYNSKYLFTAHHNDDLIETILMRLSRGSSLIGHAGFKKEIFKDNINMIKPLISVSKAEINNYIAVNNIEYRPDKSNLSDDYTRNRYRNHIIPKLKEENKNLGDKYLKYSQTLIKYDEFVKNHLNNVYNEIVKSNKIKISEFNKKEELIQEELLKLYLKNIYGDNINLINDKNILDILTLIKGDKPNASINLPNNVVISRKYDIIYIADEKSQKESINSKFKDGIGNKVGYFKIINDNDKKSNFIIRLNSKELNSPLFVRNKQKGDIIKVKGLNKYKKLKDIFINEKTDINIRKNLPLLVDNKNEIIFIPGIKKSIYDKEKGDNYDLIIQFIREEENE